MDLADFPRALANHRIDPSPDQLPFYIQIAQQHYFTDEGLVWYKLAPGTYVLRDDHCSRVRLFVYGNPGHPTFNDITIQSREFYKLLRGLHVHMLATEQVSPSFPNTRRYLLFQMDVDYRVFYSIGTACDAVDDSSGTVKGEWLDAVDYDGNLFLARVFESVPQAVTRRQQRITKCILDCVSSFPAELGTLVSHYTYDLI
jgi:hypothetical protein